MKPMAESRLFEHVVGRLGVAHCFDEVLAALREPLAGAVPFNRIAVGLLDDTGEMLRLAALDSDGEAALKLGYSDPIAGSTLAALLRDNRPRIINDLPAYLRAKPSSRSTRLMVREGMKANLSLALRVREQPFGFLFFASRAAGAYSEEHAALLGRLAGPVAASLDTARLIESLRRRNHDLEETNERLQRQTTGRPVQVATHSSAFDALWALHGLRGVCRAVDQVAGTDATVLVAGETGTGKELVVRAIHERSGRAHGPLVTVHCAAFPRELLPGELFGHEAGAFTGAARLRAGRFERAHRGTLFLDEIGEISLEAQVTLLRVLQDRVVERLGGTEPVAADVRLVAATNRDLPAAAAAGTFRADLFHRLNVFPIRVPPLRERPDDIRPLAEHFLRRFGRTGSHLPSAVFERLRTYHWPGNVRELEHLIERAAIVSTGPELEVDASWLSPTVTTCGPLSTWAEQERQIIRDALSRAHGRVYGPSGAAALLGLKPTTLYGKMRKHHIAKRPPTNG